MFCQSQRSAFRCPSLNMIRIMHYIKFPDKMHNQTSCITTIFKVEFLSYYRTFQIILMAYLFIFFILYIPVRNSLRRAPVSAIARIPSSRLKRGKRKGKLSSVQSVQIFLSLLKSMTSERCYDSHFGTNSRTGYGAAYYFQGQNSFEY